MYSAIVLCAGKGSRTGLAYNKMFYKIGEKTIYEMTMTTFLNDPKCQQVVVVCKEEERKDFASLIHDSRITFTKGGKERQDSVYEGLKQVNQDYVLIHDGARPYLKQDLIDRLLTCLQSHDACLPMVKCKDTIKRVVDGKVVETLKREELEQAQTPQAFKTSLITYAYQKAIYAHKQVTDDASVVELLDHDVYVVEGDYDNIKVTTKEDL